MLLIGCYLLQLLQLVAGYDDDDDDARVSTINEVSAAAAVSAHVTPLIYMTMSRH